MLLYLDESHRCLQQPLESSVLFSKLPQACPAVLPVARRLRAESPLHELRVRELQHLLNAWQLMGDPRRGRFVDAAETHTAFYLRYLRVQSRELLDPAAEWLDLAEMQALGEAAGPDGSPHPTADHDRLFRDILAGTPAVAFAPAGLQ